MNKTAATVVCIAVLAILPWVAGNDFYINLSTQILIYAIFALSLNLLVGYGGMTSLGHAAYLGIAAYGTAWLLTHTGLGQFGSAIGALVLTVLTAAVFGVLSLRATGLGFLMITLALGQIVWGMAYRWTDLTGGDNGMKLGHRPLPLGIDISQPTQFYYFTVLAFAISFFCLWRVVHSPFGASLRGARDQPRRMRMLGHNVWLIQLVAFVIAGFWGGVAGLLYVYYNQFVSTNVVALQQSAEVLLMSILGGASAFSGPIVGAIIITLVKNLVSSYVERWNTLLGAIFVVTVIFMPEGLVPGFAQLWRKFRGTASKDQASTKAEVKAP